MTSVMPNAVPIEPKPLGRAEEALKVYELYLADLGRIGGRHEVARAFYMTVLAALLTLLGIAVKDTLVHSYGDAIRFGSAFAGVIICGVWFLHMRSFAGLFAAKFETVRTLEQSLSFRPFTVEYDNQTLKNRWRLTSLDQGAAIVLGLAFIGLTAAASYWPPTALPTPVGAAGG